MQSPAPSEYFENIKFNYSFYTTGDAKVTLEYVNNNFLKCTGYAYSRSISTSFNGIIYALGGIETTDITASGTISANLFQGSGTELSNLNASNISAGTLAVARGGTGLSTLALGQLLIGNDTDPITQSANLIWDITNNNLGIGKNPETPLHIYNDTTAMIKLETLATGVPSIEFVRGLPDDNFQDYIMGNYTGVFKISGRSLTTTTDRIVIGTGGNVGINEASPNHKLHIHEGTTTAITCFPLKISAGAYVNAGNGTATLIGLGTQGGSTTKCAIGHCRTNSYDTGAIVFLCNSALNGTNVSMTDERMRIGSNGNISIGSTSTTTYKLLVQGSSFINNTLVFNNDARVSGSANYACNKISMYGGGFTPSTTSTYGFGIAAGTLEYFSSSAHKFYTGTTGGTGIGTQRFVILSGGNVGIGVENPTTYKLDVAGTINATNYAVGASDMFDATKKKLLSTSLDYTTLDVGDFTLGTINNARLPATISVTSLAGDGANITAINASKITTGTIDNARIALTTNKVFEHFNDKTFAVIDEKIDIPPTYSFNITSYDNPYLYGPSIDKKFKGKINASYDDRYGVYKLVSTDITKTNNTMVLNYKVGDKISIRNLADTKNDYILDGNFKYYMSMVLYKRPSNLFWVNYPDANFTQMIEWKSTSGIAPSLDPYLIDYRSGTAVNYPISTIISFTMEAGWSYYLMRFWIEISGSGPLIYPLGTEQNNYNQVFGGGQTFKFQSGTISLNTNYVPAFSYTGPAYTTATSFQPGLVKPKFRMSVDDEGGLSADAPTATEIYDKLNTSHFINNVATGKIDISTNLAELKGPKGDTGKGWKTGSAYNSTNGIVSFLSDDGLGFDTADIRGGKGDKGDKGDNGDNGTNGKGWTGATYSATTGKVSFASSDGTPFVFDTGDLRGGVGATGKGWTDASYNATTGIVTFASNDALGFSTGNLKGTNGTNGTNGKGWTGATYSATTGIVSFVSNDAGYAFTTGDLRGGAGATGKGWTSGSYASATGIVSFASNDAGYAFTTGDLRGGAGANGKGWTSGSYNATTGIVTFASNDAGYAFTTGDLRGASGATITSTQLAALMNTTDHFTLNGTKIDFKTTYKIPTAATADAVAYSGITGIPTSWTDAQIPALATSKITGLDAALTGKAPTSHTHTTAQITGLDAALTGKQATLNATSILNISDLTTTFLNTTMMNGIKNASYPMSFQNICSPTNFIKTTGLDTATNKIVYTTSGIYQLYASSVNAVNSKIENIFDANASTSWTTSANSYTKLTSVAAYTNSTFSINVIGLGLVYGEWIKIRFPRKCYVQDVLYTPFSLATSIGEGYLLGSNDEFDWEPVYPINKTFINLNEMSLINVGGVMPAIYTGTSKAFKYFTFMATTIQGTSGAAAGSTGKFAITNLRFTLYDSWVYHDNIISVGTFPSGTPVSNALDVNGNAYVSGQIITEGGINVLSGTSQLTGNVGIAKVPHATYKVDVLGDINVSGAFRIAGTAITGSKWTTGATATNIYYTAGNVGIGIADPGTYRLNVTGNTKVTGGLDVTGFSTAGNLYSSGGLYAAFTSTSNAVRDLLCIMLNTTNGSSTGPVLVQVAFGTFTGFHRVYTDDVLFNENNPDIFKNNYIGRVVISTGKIKTDLTNDEGETPIWYSAIDKDGITIEDALPIIKLSRNKKDKRVFGVLGDPKRNSNNPNRLIVNSVGEGAICVSNTNGNIENGDYIQSSDLLGYGEKQDDDLLHNYTIAKATIDCNFELDSPYYQCHEIENGVRVAFIACSYHCG